VKGKLVQLPLTDHFELPVKVLLRLSGKMDFVANGLDKTFLTYAGDDGRVYLQSYDLPDDWYFVQVDGE